jgi:hypothetical protein
MSKKQTAKPSCPSFLNPLHVKKTNSQTFISRIQVTNATACGCFKKHWG